MAEPTNSNYPVFNLSEQLTPEQLAFYDKNGFLHFKNFLSAETVQSVIKAMYEVQDKWIAENREKVNGVPIKYGTDVDGSKIVQRFAFASLFHDTLHNLLEDTRLRALFPLLQSTNERIGETEKDGLVINHYINSESSTFTKMGWHTDCLRDYSGKNILSDTSLIQLKWVCM